ncbi:MAG: YihY/virulence factor BrkB family protein [Acidobacteriia bacterium]|nr:YihY/virulence factor BrkB family protein [Terriglobia bacterium]
MRFTARIATRAYRTLRRVFPRCATLSQAIAFNLFLAFFPTLLMAIALATTPVGGRANLLELIRDFTKMLPPDSQQIVSEFLVKRGPDAWRWFLLGWTGTLLAGSQVMMLLMDGIRVIYDDPQRMAFHKRLVRGLLLLVVTMVPMLSAAILGVLGRPLRHWLAAHFGQSSLLRADWTVFFQLIAILLGIIALTIIYRMARPAERTLRGVLPGAILATLLWWLVDVIFGTYVRKMQYGVVYGGLAAAIGLLLWMQISASVIFLGAAWNAESSARHRKLRSAD